MTRGLYTSATHMVTQRNRMDVLTNNIANIETAGFKADTVISRSFRDLLLSKVDDPAVLHTSSSVGPLNTGVRVDEVSTSFVQGNIEHTQSPTDVCIIGDGFFVVSTPYGDRYTRDGSFSVNSQGYLTSADGNYIMGLGGMIHVGDTNFTINHNGDVVTSDGAYAGRMRIAGFEDETGLRKAGGNLYYNYTGQPVNDAQGFELRQGSLEASNVNIASEMVNMLTLYRSYETSQRVLRMMDESVGKAVNDVGRV